MIYKKHVIILTKNRHQYNWCTTIDCIAKGGCKAIFVEVKLSHPIKYVNNATYSKNYIMLFQINWGTFN